MKRFTKKNALCVGIIATTLAATGCGQGQDNPVGPTLGHAPDSIPPVKQGAQLAGSYPSYSFALSIPFKAQVLPGDWDYTRNCGQTSVVMIAAKFNGTPATAQAITEANSWLAKRFNDTRFLSPNGHYTSIGDGRNTLGVMLKERYNLNYSVACGADPSAIISHVAAGRPVIATVMIYRGKLVASGGVPHFVVVVGWNGNIIVHDPGSSTGNYRQYSVAEFNASWGTQGRQYAPVWK